MKFKRKKKNQRFFLILISAGDIWVFNRNHKMADKKVRDSTTIARNLLAYCMERGYGEGAL